MPRFVLREGITREQVAKDLGLIPAKLSKSLLVDKTGDAVAIINIDLPIPGIDFGDVKKVRGSRKKRLEKALEKAQKLSYLYPYERLFP